MFRRSGLTLAFAGAVFACGGGRSRAPAVPGAEQHVAEMHDDGRNAAPTNDGHAPKWSVDRIELLIVNEAVVNWWRSLPASDTYRFRDAHAALSPDASRLAVAVEVGRVEDVQAVVFVFDLSGSNGVRRLNVQAEHLAFTPSGERLVTYGGDTGDRHGRAYRLWDVATSSLLGVRRTPVAHVDDSRRPTVTVLARQRSLISKTGLTTIRAEPLGRVDRLAMLDEERALVRSLHAISFEVAGGIADWYPDALSFGEGRAYADIGGRCVSGTQHGSSQASIFDAVDERLVKALPLPRFPKTRLHGAALPHVATTDQCRFVAVVDEHVTWIYDADNPGRELDVGAGEGRVFLLRDHLIVATAEPERIVDLRDGSHYALRPHNRRDLDDQALIEWVWVEVANGMNRRILGARVQGSRDRIEGTASPVSIVLWKLAVDGD